MGDVGYVCEFVVDDGDNFVFDVSDGDVVVCDDFCVGDVGFVDGVIDL